MPRTARRESRTDIYHVITRGNNKNWIFKETKYKRLTRNQLYKQQDIKLIEIYALCIMDNHMHIVLKAKKPNLAKVMWNINRVFARRYNYNERHFGHVYESRYKSEPVDEEGYLLKVIRYVHNNPVKAKIVEKPEAYKWSSYNDYLKLNCNKKTINVIKEYFNNDTKEFKDFHKEEDKEEYLEIKEDIELARIEKAQGVIDEFCRKHQITSHTTIMRNESVKWALVKMISKESKLSYRKIGELTGLSYSSVQYICSRKR